MRIGIFSLIAWDFIQQRPHKFAEELAALGHTIFYIEPPDLTGSRADRLRRALPGRRHRRSVAPGITALRPLVIPPFRAYAHLLPLNRLLQPLAARQLRELRLDFAIVLATEYGPVVRALGIPFAYDHVDDTQFMEHVLTEQFVRDMDALRRDGAFTIYIQRAAARTDPKGIFIPNGADLDQFQPLPTDKLFDAVILSNIARWFDMDAVLGSRKRILLIGPMDVDGGNNRERFFAANRPNLAWIPQVDKQVANQWLSRAEVGLVPFNYKHPVVRYAMPIKILEYFLAGLPVVTYHNEGIEDMYGDMVSFYAGDGTRQSLDAAIDEARTKRDRDYRAFAERYQWRDIVAELETHILKATGHPPPPRRPRTELPPPPRLLAREAVAPLLAPPVTRPTQPLQIVYWGLVDWAYLRQRPQHLARELSRFYDVLYAFPAPLSELARGHRLLPFRERPTERLLLLRPRALSPGRLPRVQMVNNRRYTAAIRQQLNPARPVVLWLSHPQEQPLQIGQHGERLVCYDCMDLHPAFKAGAASAAVAAAEAAVLRRADLVFVSSTALLAHAEAHGARAVLVPNGVELDHFVRAAIEPLPLPTSLSAIPRPRLLCYGTLGPWLDTHLVAALADRRPDWQILLLGTAAGADLGPLAGRPNVHLLGVRPYEELPAFLQHADVCLLPFVVDDLTRAVDPVKVYEYLAAGKPVVATPLPELAKFGALVETATTAEEMAARIERHITQPEDEAQRLERLAVAARHTWHARATVIAQTIEAALAERTTPMLDREVVGD